MEIVSGSKTDYINMYVTVCFIGISAWELDEKKLAALVQVNNLITPIVI